MFIGIDINETTEFKSKHDPDKENPTIFLIGNISNDKKMNLFADIFDAEGKPDASKLKQKAVPIVKAGLKGIKGMIDPKTKEKTDYNVATDDVINLLPLEVIAELMEVIVDINFVGEQEQKN